MSERYALITGTSSGLGLEMARSLLDQGYSVFGISRSGSPIEHSEYTDIVCDIRSEVSVEEMYDIIRESTEELHLIINNAAVFEMALLQDTSSHEFTNHLTTNVLGAFHILKHCQNFLIEGESHIINISSIAAKKGYASLGAYCASKFALDGMIQSYKEEIKHLNVRMTTLHPGAIDTPIWEGVNQEIPKNQMLTIEEFMQVFDFVTSSSQNIEFSDITFNHKSGE